MVEGEIRGNQGEEKIIIIQDTTHKHNRESEGKMRKKVQ